MSDPLIQIYEIQQSKIAEANRRTEAARARRQRTINAFRNSGLPAMFIEFADVPLAADVAKRTFLKKYGELCWAPYDPRATNTNEISLRKPCGSDRSARWWCAENDMGHMTYYFNNGESYGRDTHCDQPEGEWLNFFIQHAAEACDPAAIAEMMQKRTPSAPKVNAKPAKRKILA